VEGGQRRDRSCERNCGEAAATSLFAKFRSGLCITSTRCRERHCLHDLLDRRAVPSGLHFWRPGVLVSAWRSDLVRLLTVPLFVAKV
jgi:hypothetical protein